MPEGDSVWKLARRLDRQLAGHTVVRSDFRTPALATRDLSGREVLGHDTHGKHLLTRFGPMAGSPGATLHSHLRMDGSWSTLAPGKRLPGAVQPHVRLVLGLDDGRTVHGIRLHDLALVPTDREGDLVGHLGPDPLRDDWDAEEAVRRLRRDPTTPLVTALLDQRAMAGLGNLWVNELAFLSGVSPWTAIGDVDVAHLVDRAARMLRHSATVEGAYQVTTGSSARGDDHWVTGRQRQGCRRCGGPVSVSAEVPGDAANRRTWWCRACQPGPGPEARVGAGPGVRPRAGAGRPRRSSRSSTGRP
ncbi:Fpg/Nei family DNA glycosylase [Nocardioides sp. zg-1308]|uniref:DNA-(apurinic or apyrimidinic site) lyase n=1 Tax=Nocardioides renjunii TaxID=3095075 RepID=A0ABU5KD36_9ACTN|nr:Fpg/Nei family DNA glycosylase [Nocardioides sp. S-58]MDZ5662852.1 Fpg/Nei family DNA glycosylase [Nocardioides sp. S-58]NPD05480.1 Fpg/Nei family DNA glycosylase [Nocardioides sp. zg-1308]